MFSGPNNGALEGAGEARGYGSAPLADSGTERPGKRRPPLGPLHSGATRPLDVGLQQTNREPHHGPYAGNGHCRASVLASERLDAKSWRSRAHYLCSSSSPPPFTHAQLGYREPLSVTGWDEG